MFKMEKYFSLLEALGKSPRELVLIWESWQGYLCLRLWSCILETFPKLLNVPDHCSQKLHGTRVTLSRLDDLQLSHLRFMISWPEALVMRVTWQVWVLS